MNWVAGSAAELQQYLNRDYRASNNRLADSLEYFTQQDCSNLFEAEYTSPASFRAPELISTLLAQPPTVSRSKAGELKRLYGQEGAVSSIWTGGSDDGIEGKKRAKQPYSQRSDTARALLQKAVSHGVVFIIAPPASGKTSLLQCIQDLANQKRNVLKNEKLVHYADISYTACTACSPRYTFSQAYARWNKRPFFSEEGRTNPAQQLSGHSVPVRLILVDETQEIYKRSEHMQFWALVKDLGLRREQPGVAIIAAATATALPCRIGPAQRVLPNLRSLQEDAEEPALSINYSPEEFWGFYVDYLASEKLQDSSAVQALFQLLYVITEGMPGPLDHLLQRVKSNYIRKLGHLPEKMASEATAYLRSKRMLADCTSCLCFPRSELFKPKERNKHFLELMEDIVQRGGQISVLQLRRLSQSAQMEAQEQQSRGLLVEVYGVYFLASRLHLEVVRYLLLGSKFDGQAQIPTSLPVFMRLAVKKIEPTVLQRTASTIRATGKRLELVYTAELYRAFMALLPEDCTVSPDYGNQAGVEGRVNLYLWPMRWAVELLREDDKIAEHMQRFAPASQTQPEWKYHMLLREGKVAQYIVVDCYGHTTGHPTEQLQGVMYLKFSADCRTAEMTHNGTRETIHIIGSKAKLPSFRHVFSQCFNF